MSDKRFNESSAFSNVTFEKRQNSHWISFIIHCVRVQESLHIDVSCVIGLKETCKRHLHIYSDFRLPFSLSLSLSLSLFPSPIMQPYVSLVAEIATVFT